MRDTIHIAVQVSYMFIPYLNPPSSLLRVVIFARTYPVCDRLGVNLHWFRTIGEFHPILSLEDSTFLLKLDVSMSHTPSFCVPA
jgi:hypothetical protein